MNHQGELARLFLAVLFLSSLGTAAFAFSSTVHAKGDRCCLLIASCMGSQCKGDDDCFEPGGRASLGGFCCDYCD